MTYNEIFQAELKSGKSEIEASQNARYKMNQLNYQRIKNRTIFDSKNPGTLSI